VFQVAEALRPRRLEEFPSVEALRRHLAQAVGDYRREQARALVADFDRTTFDFESDFYRIGGGSLGGKARGLAFVRRLLAERGLTRRFTGVEIAVPAAVVLGTDVFDRFLDENGLRHFAIECDDDEEIARRFAAAPFPAEAERDLAAFLAKARFPLAVRSSSLLEDSQHQPFTGVYDTCMLANDGADDAARLARALAAIRRVYASTFTRAAKVSRRRPTAWKRSAWRSSSSASSEPRTASASIRRSPASRARSTSTRRAPCAPRTGSPRWRSAWGAPWSTAAPACASAPAIRSI
jgi:hypothetical protein